ncbi:MAG TPA: SGNH/GDSL hydrolase family protein [Candidatus Binatia bacterium]|nr:SGNH/GDSL hydrolase family protein [Candidatus Binatia bacterium]
MSARRRALRRLVFFAAVLGLFYVVLAKYSIDVLHWMFPSNPAFQKHINPVFLGHLEGARVDLGQTLLHFVLKPYTGFQHPGNVDAEGVFAGVKYHFQTNNQGFLTRYDLDEVAGSLRAKDPDERVLIVAGGSAAFGWGASENAKTFPYLLEDLLNRSDVRHRWRVYNFATGGWIAYQEYLALDLYGSPLEPDWVVLFDGRNDVVVPTLHGERVPNYFFYQGERKLNVLFEDLAASPWDPWLPFLRYRRLAKRLEDVAAPPPQVLDRDEIDRAVRFYLHAVESVALRFADRKVLVMTQPEKLYNAGNPDDAENRLIRRGYDQIIPGTARLTERYPNLRYNNATTGFLDPYLVDDCHLSDGGHELVARKLAEIIGAELD